MQIGFSSHIKNKNTYNTILYIALLNNNILWLFPTGIEHSKDE